MLRHDGIAIGDMIRISPAISTGFSMVTDLIGIERERAGWFPENGPVNLLFYLGPEINVTATAFPNWEAFFRIHHRSGPLRHDRQGGRLERRDAGRPLQVLGHAENGPFAALEPPKSSPTSTLFAGIPPGTGSSRTLAA